MYKSGLLRLVRRAPESLIEPRGAPDWYGTGLTGGLKIGEKLITPAGYVLLTAIEDPNQVQARDNDRGAATIPARPSTGPLDADTAAQYAEDLDAARYFAESSLSESTRRAYESDWRQFVIWCQKRHRRSFPADPETVAVFLASEGRLGLNPSTIARRLAAIGYVHTAKDHPAPQTLPGLQIKSVMGGIRREKSVRPAKKRPLTPDLLKLLLATIDPDQLSGIRDAALLLFGFASAMRRSELAALQIENLGFSEGGVSISIERSKTDQDAEGRLIRVPRGGALCPVRALEDWIAEARLRKGPLFRRISKSGRVLEQSIGGEYICVLVKSYAGQAGLDASDFGAHSLRRGWMTAAARAGGDLKDLMEQAGHKNQATALEYIEAEQGFENHPGKRLL